MGPNVPVTNESTMKSLLQYVQNQPVFETRTTTGRDYFACQGSGVSQIFILSSIMAIYYT